MHAFCTYCSNAKSKDEGEIPAIKRYRDPRIRKVCEAASILEIEFYILSGEFGLIPPDRPIPWYDHLLLPEEVDELVERMVAQIRHYKIDGVTYFTNAIDNDPNLAPYHSAIVIACNRVPCACSVVEIELVDEPCRAASRSFRTGEGKV
jgi:hypothetical protein